MNLDFAALSHPAPRRGGHPGTPGTGPLSGVSGRSAHGDIVGTTGDSNGPCPRSSPVCPQPQCTPFGPIHWLSPLSPRVPTPNTQDEVAEGEAREWFEERAAIMEFDGGLTRVEAERLSADLVTRGA